MITLYAVRHGETNFNKEGRVQGTVDSMLTDFGKAQAEAVAEYFVDKNIDVIYASPLTRAWDTAEAIAKVTSIEPIPVDMFMELNCGKFQNMLLSEISGKDMEEWQKFLTDPAEIPDGGESMNMLSTRVKLALNEILNRGDENANIAIVSHAGVVRMTMAALMNVSVQAAVNFGLSNGSIAKFINKYDRWTCLKWNDTEHLGKLEGEVKFVL